ncbi:MAG: trypsin-like peptidase domain-containing protein [Bacteroidota bacterium]|nr:trypsin-like peptidase domain-containing protein [Ferruginibacter sp.]
MRKILAVLLLSIASIAATAQMRDFYKTTVNATILLYKKANGHLKSHGTAFILYNYNPGSDESILVTCEHVTHHDTLIAAIPATDSLKNALISKNQHSLTYTSNGGRQTVGFDGVNLLFNILVKPGENYYKHPRLDLATIFCNLPTVLVNKTNTAVQLTDMKTLPKSVISERNEMYAGQEITFIGFPSGIGTQNGFFGSNMYRDAKANPLFRKGIVSWTSENAELFLVDGFSYGGNSGSPIFSVPNSESPGKFLGMVIGHLNDEFELTSFSMDTLKKQPVQNITSIPINNGLAQCIPSYIIYDFAMEAAKSREMRTAGKKIAYQ